MWRQPNEIFIVTFLLILIFSPVTPFALQRFNCPKSYTFPNARLRGGLQAGKFKRLGPPDDTELCVQRCCDQRSCDLVAWIGEHCYSVSCFSRELCTPVRLASYNKGMRLLYIASREDAEDEVEPNRREVNDIFHSLQSDTRSFNISKKTSLIEDGDLAVKKSTTEDRRIIRSLEEIEDEEHSGSIEKNGINESANNSHETILFSGNFYERGSENMNFKMEQPSGGEDWEGGLLNESGTEQDDDVTDDIIQTQTHPVTAVKRTEMASVVSPSDIEEFESSSQSGSGESLLDDRIEEELRQEGGEDSSADFSSLGSAFILDEKHADGSGKINRTIMREVQSNLRKVWRYAAAGKSLGMMSKGPKSKEQEQKAQEIYNLVIKHESEFVNQHRMKPKESVKGESGASGSEDADQHKARDDSWGGGEDDSDEKHESGSGILRESEEEALVESVENDISGESSGLSDSSKLPSDSGSGSGIKINRKLLKEVEQNLHKVWRYAAPKKDLDMVAKGPKGEEELEKVKKIYNMISKHESGSAFIDYEMRKKGKPLNDGRKTPGSHRRHKSRKSRVKIIGTGHNGTESKLYTLQKARKYRYNQDLKNLKPWGMGMEKSGHKPSGMYTKKIGRKDKAARNKQNALTILRQEMKDLAENLNENSGPKKYNDTSKVPKLANSKSDGGKSVGDSHEAKLKHATSSAGDNSLKFNEHKHVSLDKTQLEIGKTLEELILTRMAQLQSQRKHKKRKGKQEHLKDKHKKEEKAEMVKEASKVKPQPNKDKLLKELEKLKFLNGPSTVYNESRFVYLKQCGLYVEEYNVSKTRASWNNDLFSPYSYLYEMPKNYHTCNSSLWMNSTDLRGDVFLSFRVMSIKGSTMTNNANICEKYCCQEPRCQSWTLRFQKASTANCPKGSFCCWLKSAIPTPIRDQEHCTSGIVHRESTRHPPSGMRSAVPLGGLGTGSFELRADGTIHEWTLENQSPGGSAKLNKGALNLAVFGVRVSEVNKDKSKAALLRIHAPHGYPGVDRLSYSGSYPVSKLTPGGSITENVDMSLYAFSSFHVRHRYKSAVPAVAFTLGMRNKADRPLNVSFMFNLPLGQQEDTIRVGDNYGEVVFTRMIKPSDCAHACSKMPKCMSWTTNGPTSCLLKDKMPLHAWATGIVSGLKGEWSVKDSMLTCHRPGFFPQSGSTTLYAVDDEDSSGSFAVADDFGDIWKNFSNTGKIGTTESLNNTGLYGAASVMTQLQPGEKKSLTLILSWYYPNRDVAKVHVGNLYSALFKSSQDVANHMRKDLLQSVMDILSWHEPIVGSTPARKEPINDKVKHIPKGPDENRVNELPDWLKDLLVNSMSFWRSGFWAEDGRWRQWEAFDCNDIDTIQNDMQRIIPYTLFFPELVRELLTAWADNQYSSGMLQEALTSGCLGPTGKLDYSGGRVMADTTAMFVVGLYHYFQWTGDQATLDRLWPAAKRAMAWVMVDSTKGTGLPFRKVSTYDIVALDKYDHDAYNSFVYLLVLRAAQEMGTIKNDTKFTSSIHRAFNQAQKRIDVELWDENKQYYHTWWDMEYGSPEWIMSDSLYGQVWAYSLGLGDLVPRSKLKEHLLSEVERNDSPFGLKVLNTGETEITQEDTSIILSHHVPGCKSLENITKHNSVWMGADADWSSLMLHLDTDPIIALNRAKKSLDHWRSTLNDQWNIHGLISSSGYGLDGLPWATSHYSFHMVLWHIPLAVSGQQYFAPNASLTFWPKFPIPFSLPFFTPRASGIIEGAYVKGNDREEEDSEEEEMFTFTVKSGEITLKELSILGSRYGEGEISIKQGETVTWSRPKQDVKNILQQL